MSDERRPGDADAELGLALERYRAGLLEDAARICRDLVSHEPGPADAWHLLGAISQRYDDHWSAAHEIEKAIQLAPDRAEFFNSLGISCRELQKLDDAERSFRRATELNADFAGAHNNLGNVLRELGRLEDAEASFRRAAALKPDLAEPHGNLGIVLRLLGRLEESEQSLRRAIGLDPRYAEAHNDLGATLFGVGRLEEAERCYRAALALDPDLAVAQRNLIFLLNYVERDPASVFAEHREFARRYYPSADPPPYDNTPDPRRRLRVGYVSGDLRRHPVGFFIEPVLANHDSGGFEIFCYSSAPAPDDLTARLKSFAPQWRDVSSLPVPVLADRIRADAIDVLVDLSGHTTHNRLGAFARRPAPVQASWLGYLNTTGMEAMGYRITDPRASPEGMFEACHTEKLVRLPDSQWCFQPPEGCPEVVPPPSTTTGEVTFAAFANPAKMGPEVIKLWGRLLERVPKSRLLIVTNGLASIPAGYVGRFASLGVPEKRVTIRGSLPFAEYLALHNQADVILDTFPYAGGTTSCHALWMGVPVVTLAGHSPPSRGGASLLHTLGLEELVAQDPGRYLDIAAKLAADPARLAAMRAGMRERMRRSPLMDAAGFTRHLESAYRGMWKAWCGGRSVLGHRIGSLLRKLGSQ